MTADRLLDRILQQEAVNFALTNRIPRALATRVVARISRSEHPVVRGIAMRVWTLFAGDLALHEARTSHFRSVHDCFTRQLKDGARPVDPAPDVLVSPCDGIVGACGAIDGTRVFQAKGRPYTLGDLFQDQDLESRHRGGCYVTLRLTSAMYHRFHAPDDGEIDAVTYVAGDTWNVNRAALARVDRLFCQNERAVVPLRLTRSTEAVSLVAVAAILVASIRLHFIDSPLNVAYAGPRRIRCRAALRRGDEMGYFEHGSTMIVFGTRGLALATGISEGHTVRMGRPLLRHVGPCHPWAKPPATGHPRSGVDSMRFAHGPHRPRPTGAGGVSRVRARQPRRGLALRDGSGFGCVEPAIERVDEGAELRPQARDGFTR